MSKFETGTEQLLCNIEDSIATITLNRPDKRNALSDVLTPALRETLLALDEDPQVRCLILTGAGSAFCAGGDISGMAGTRSSALKKRTQEEATRDLLRRQESLTLRLHELSKPTIAALPGPAAGAGFSIALACDLRIGATSAFIKTAFANIGLPGDYGGSWQLTHLVGPAKAKELYFLNPKLDSAQCLALGLFNEVVADDQLQIRAREIAVTIANGPPIALRYIKSHINAAIDGDLRSCLASEAAHTVRCANTADHKEAVNAFLEKRVPQFVGA
ncbi:MAG: enoyl-CoA hydratase [Proteobacteria bacterium]|nr:enoyl-CoA hydratase [Pseudomonadota bacterium]